MSLRVVLEVVVSFLGGVFIYDSLLKPIVGYPSKVLAIITGFIFMAQTIYSRPGSEKRYERARKENKKIKMLLHKPPIWFSVFFILLFLFKLREFFGF